MNLSKTDLSVILALDSDPLMPLKKVALLTKLSWPTVKKKYVALQENHILRGIVATYHPKTIGLERTNVFVEVEDMSSLMKVEDAGRSHPYTAYRTRVLHGRVGIFLQFNAPTETSNHIREYFQKMKQEKIISDFKTFRSSGRRFEHNHNLKDYNRESMQWNFNWSEWIANIQSGPIDDVFAPAKKLPLTSIKPIDLEILRLFTKDASIKQSDIMNKFSLSRSSAHEHYYFVKDNIISSIRLNYDRSYFDLTETYIVFIETPLHNDMTALIRGLHLNKPPFRTAVDLLEDGSILLWVNMSKSQFNKFSYVIWDRFPTARFYQLNTTDTGAARYWFYPPNFDFTTYSWKCTRRYMVEEPLARVLQK